jgi:hypothetical protein
MSIKSRIVVSAAGPILVVDVGGAGTLTASLIEDAHRDALS